MKAVLEVLNDLQKEGVIEKYALGGATALLFYTEPALTYDIDVFVFLPQSQKASSLILDLGPLYKTLQTKGFQSDKEHVLIGGVPVQFIPAYNSLVEEAVREAKIESYEGAKVNVVRLEYLLAIMLDTGRAKDKERIKNLLESASVDKKQLAKILSNHSLKKKWEKEFGKA